MRVFQNRVWRDGVVIAVTRLINLTGPGAKPGTPKVPPPPTSSPEYLGFLSANKVAGA